MTDWPDTLTVSPMREWPGDLTPVDARRPSPFDATLTATLRLLDRELYHLTLTNEQRRSAELLVAIPADRFKRDGTPYANAIPSHPGVVLSLDSVHGHLSYPCDTFPTWQANLRAIALALEALRKVDRYGVTKRGQQYRGFLELESSSGRTSLADAESVIARFADGVSQGETWGELLRRAKRRTHPDHGGRPEEWHAVAEAEAVLREAGRL